MPDESPLTFTELDTRLRAIPDGPAGILDTPRPYRVTNIVSGIGALVALIPYVLIKVMTPAMWMLTMAQIGMAIFFVMALPGMVRSYGVLGWTLWRWREDQVSQLDHDLPHMRRVLAWLSQYPEATLDEHLRHVRMRLVQMHGKIGLLAGGVDRLGILPVLASAYLFMRNWRDLLDMPLWQIMLGFGLILLYFVITTANLMRVRLQLYESFLSDAKAVRPR